MIEDGFGSQRRVRRVNRTDRLARLVIIANAGYITLDAMRWLTDTRTAFAHIDLDGTLITTSVVASPDLAGLKRSQALAQTTPAGVQIARYLLALKVSGQRDVLSELPGAHPDAVEAIGVAAAMIARADTLAGLLAGESYAASAYWQAWGALPIPFGSGARIPEHWRTFGQRASLITGGPRLATDPANAVLNLLYSLLESETVLACHAVGLDPTFGLFHTDQRDRASMALDIMEAARPAVDAYVLALLTQRTLNPRDYSETRAGTCRISPRLAEQLVTTCDIWREHIAPIVETIARMLAEHATSRVPNRTPITQTNRRAATAERIPDRKQHRSRAAHPVLPATCRVCGVALTDRRRRYCDLHRRDRFIDANGEGRARAAQILATLRAEQRDPAHGGRAAQLRGTKNAAHQAAVKVWKGERPTPEQWAAILPGLRHRPIAELTAATGLSAHYCSLIRLGKRTPHPRHWPALRALTAISRQTPQT